GAAADAGHAISDRTPAGTRFSSSCFLRAGAEGKALRADDVRAALFPKARRGFIAGVELEAMAESLAPRLIAYALARTGCRATAEDIAQEALTARVVRWRRARPRESSDG